MGVMQITGPVLEETHYYPFGLTMSTISNTTPLKLENRFKFNGKELNHKEFSDGVGLEWYDYGARMQDPQLGRWWAIDPLASNYFSVSPYNYALNDPTNTIDIDGRKTTSTHTDSSGNVLAVFNDGDNGVYVHNGATSASGIEKAHSNRNTSSGGIKVGETEFWDEFALHNSQGDILGNANGNFADVDAHINFGVSMDNEISNLNSAVASIFKELDGVSATLFLKASSSNRQWLDIKKDIGANQGFLFKGKYVSGESLGNYLFGLNLETLRESTILDNVFLYSKLEFFHSAVTQFGRYNNKQNGTNLPFVPPYYGETLYSGRQVTLGYWGNNMNDPIFNLYGQGLGNVKIK
ncbi:MAG: hypothetical protein EPN39_21195 [Chitinophagaceae bacterium]|nr:MAG: hypothetical protein EPN39_21195 [Chitinophagaceae bacterium]